MNRPEVRPPAFWPIYLLRPEPFVVPPPDRFLTVAQERDFAALALTPRRS